MEYYAGWPPIEGAVVVRIIVIAAGSFKYTTHMHTLHICLEFVLIIIRIAALCTAERIARGTQYIRARVCRRYYNTPGGFHLNYPSTIEYYYILRMSRGADQCAGFAAYNSRACHACRETKPYISDKVQTEHELVRESSPSHTKYSSNRVFCVYACTHACKRA